MCTPRAAASSGMHSPEWGGCMLCEARRTRNSLHVVAERVRSPPLPRSKCFDLSWAQLPSMDAYDRALVETRWVPRDHVGRLPFHAGKDARACVCVCVLFFVRESCAPDFSGSECLHRCWHWDKCRALSWTHPSRLRRPRQPPTRQRSCGRCLFGWRAERFGMAEEFGHCMLILLARDPRASPGMRRDRVAV